MDETVDITPIGSVTEKGIRMPLPLEGWLPFPAIRRGGIALEPGESTVLRYDMDDVNFSEIVVRDANGARFALVTDPHAAIHLYHSPQSHYQVAGALLEPASQELIDVADAAQDSRPAICFYSVVLAPWLIGGVWYAVERRRARTNR